jgi:hypothetical protein
MSLKSQDIITLLISQLGIQDFEFKLIRHQAMINWRQQYGDFYSKLTNISSAILFENHNEIPLLGHDLIKSNIDNLTTPSKPLISLTSLIISPEGKHFHLPMMNLHLDYPIGLDKLRKTLNELIGPQYYLLKTDRFYHVYGQSLMNNKQWEQWNLKFLMIDALVSPRYIGYSLERKYNPLRINATNYIKTMVPYLATDENAELDDLKVFVITKHGSQLRKNGEPYFYHLFEVEKLSSEIAYVLNLGEKEVRIIQQASLLHDILEDTDTDYEDIVKISSQRVANMVVLLSADKRRSKQRRDELYLNVIKNASLSVQIIKLADIYSNLSSIYQAYLRRNPVNQAFVTKAERFLSVLNPVLCQTQPFKICNSMIKEMADERRSVQVLP